MIYMLTAAFGVEAQDCSSTARYARPSQPPDSWKILRQQAAGVLSSSSVCDIMIGETFYHSLITVHLFRRATASDNRHKSDWFSIQVQQSKTITGWMRLITTIATHSSCLCEM